MHVVFETFIIMLLWPPQTHEGQKCWKKFDICCYNNVNNKIRILIIIILLMIKIVQTPKRYLFSRTILIQNEVVKVSSIRKC